MFIHRMEYPTRKFPVFEIGDTQETSHPFRRARSLVVRLPLTRHSVVIGRWGQEQEEESALIRALQLGEKRQNVQEGQGIEDYLYSTEARPEE
jgi:hypothetical protein